LDNSELQELGLLYRQTASDLSVVLEDKTSVQLAAYLNQLLGRSHNLLYMGRSPKAAALWRFYSQTYPRLFRETWRSTLLATVVFAAAAIAGWAVTLHDPGFAHRILGPQMMDTIERREMWTHSIVSVKPMESSHIMTNNLTVSLSTFALGVTGGLGTVLMLAFNGLLFGVISGACWKAGMLGQLMSFVAPHGVIELPAIFIAGGAGLLLAKGLLFPGTLPRRASLAREGGRAVRLVLGIVPMLIVAGTIEGFVSPTELAVKWKYTVAAGMFCLLLLYVMRKPSRPALVASFEQSSPASHATPPVPTHAV
jgi:uncharacterized membrane protein SpoIIM required for sporulation